MTDTALLIWGQLLQVGLAAALGVWLGWRLTKRGPKSEPAPAPPPREARSPNEELFERCRAAEENVGALKHSLLQLPELAQRLLGCQNLRQAPEVVLDLMEEIFAPSYALFYRLHRGEFVAVGKRGVCEFEIGHRVKAGEGVVGWTALRQLAFTGADAAHESRTVRERDLAAAMPVEGFTVCAPFLSGERTMGVILVGPTLRNIEAPKELSRMVALLTSVAITNLQVLQREHHLAQTDGLTGLLNKRTVLEYLRSTLAGGSRSPVSVFMFDIDFFKKYNDVNGHLAGDDLLKGMGELMREHSRDGEGLGRYGGEEFVLVLPGVPKEHALAVAERLRALVESAHFANRETMPGGKITISGGVATWPHDGDDATALLRAADEALYQGKRAGRNRVVAYHVPDLASLDGNDEAEIEKDVR